MKNNGLIISLRESKILKGLSALMVVLFISNIVFPLQTFALTSGPSQEEYTSFEPFQTTDMVDLYTGDFTYNIPLLSIPGPNGGYPINLAYHSGIGMEQEASWVGLGWTLNVGAINRVLRGNPDDFNGEEVVQKTHQKPFKNTSVNLPTNIIKEAYGVSQATGKLNGINMAVNYNNYKGVGYSLSFNRGFGEKSCESSGLGMNLGLSFDSQNGVNYNAGVSYGVPEMTETKVRNYDLGLNISAQVNSRKGLTSVSFSNEFSLERSISVYSKEGKYKGEIGIRPSVSHNMSYPINSYVPPVKLNATSNIKSMTTKFSSNITAAAGIANFKRQRISYDTYVSNIENTTKSNAYGLFYAENGTGDDALSDVNPSNMVYHKDVLNIGAPSLSNDLFIVNGQGTGGIFRSWRNDYQIYSPNLSTNITIRDSDLYGQEYGLDPSSNLEFAAGAEGFLGFSAETKTGKWEEGALPSSNPTNMGLNENSSNKYDYAYLKMNGELTGEQIQESDLYGLIENEAVRHKLVKTGSSGSKYFAIDNKLTTGGANAQDINNIGNTSNLANLNSEKSVSNVQKLDWSEAMNYGYAKNIVIYDESNRTNMNHSGSYTKDDLLTRATANGLKKTQFSEINILQSDGSLYNYGLPAINLTQTDAQFRVPNDLLDNSNYKTYFESAEENYQIQNIKTSGFQDGSEIKKESGPKGFHDEFVSETSTEAYAHSWLLTSILSYDYLDSDNTPGPSDGDDGYWVKFNYKKLDNEYKWRAPFTGANYLTGALDDPYDNSGAFTYGEKEIYFTESIETKTHIAVFYTSPRADGFEAEGYFASEFSRGTQSMHQLDKIELYSKADLAANSGVLANTKPIKTVNLNFNHELCKGIYNHSSYVSPPAGETEPTIPYQGKLTLKSLSFNYNGSDRGDTSPYEFSYANNFDYDPLAVDRWGNYKGYPTTLNAFYPKNMFSFTEQIDYDDNIGNFDSDDQEIADSYASAWCLNKIDMPSGGSLNIEYEADDYSFVEDQPAMQMMDIYNLNNSDTDPDIAGDLDRYEMGAPQFRIFEQSNIQNKYIWFKLKNPVSSDLEFKEKYLKNMTEVYFEAMLKLDAKNKTLNENEGKDLIKGWAKLEVADYGVDDLTQSYGYIVLKEENIGRKKSSKTIHPFQKMGIEYIRNMRPDMMYGGVTGQVNPATLVSFFADIAATIAGFNRIALREGYASAMVVKGQSKIRVYSPDKKIGGGARVKKIYVEESVFGITNTYGQVYDYSDGEKSSGVAYEPAVGKNESPLVTPIRTNQQVAPLTTPFTQVVETPLMSDYYPGSNVGYGKVTIRSINSTESNLDYAGSATDKQSYKTASTSTEVLFYTPKDFPVFVDQTPISDEARILSLGYTPGVGIRFDKSLARSQGYSIVLNDMAGKLKKKTSFIPAKPTSIDPESERVVLNSVEHIYQTSSTNPRLLDNKVSCLTSNGCIDAVLGEKIDFFSYAQENSSHSSNMSAGISGTLCLQAAPPFFCGASIAPSYEAGGSNDLSFKSIVTNKVVYKTGIKSETIVKDKESSTRTKNIHYDLETGTPIYSKIENNYRDDIYSLSIPAHFRYDNMLGSYKNLGKKFNLGLSSNSIGMIDVNFDVFNILKIGDVLFVDVEGPNNELLTVVEKDVNNNSVKVIDANGDYFNRVGEVINSIQIIKSGYDNLQSVSLGNYVSLGDMLASNCVLFKADKPEGITKHNLLSASSVTFSDYWKVDKEYDAPTQGNPYKLGMRGLWLIDKSLTYNGDRNYSASIDVRNDGLFSANIYDVNTAYPNTLSDWQIVSEASKYSSSGFNIESKNAIGVYSAALYGYGNSLVTAVANNSEYNEIVSDGFEDYDFYLNHEVDHWNFNKYLLNVTNVISQDFAHTGVSSIKIEPNSSVDVKSYFSDCDGTEDYYIDDVSSQKFIINPCGTNGKFSPKANKKYFVSVWVKSSQNNPAEVTGAYISLTAKLAPSGLSVPLSLLPPEGSIIEGWQKISGYFEIPSNYESLEVSFNNTSNNDLYYDDFRIQPAESQMVTYVYNVNSLKPVALLDDNNFATFYIYNDQDLLEKTKIETARGIKTINEGRIGDIQK
jgi:hypothetical protein